MCGPHRKQQQKWSQITTSKAWQQTRVISLLVLDLCDVGVMRDSVKKNDPIDGGKKGE
jgi:hypothetical protein